MSLELDPAAAPSDAPPDAMPDARASTGGPDGPVLIAGGGIAGLATALALARRGIGSTVIEARTSAPEEGAGIQLGPNGTRILAELGVADDLRLLVGRPEEIRVKDARSGAELARLPLGAWLERRHAAPYWVAHRADLHAALRERAVASPLIEHITGARVVHVEQETTRVRIETADGRRPEGAALVIADGVWSRLRRAVLADAGEPSFSGRVAARSVMPIANVPAALRASATHVWMAPGAHVVHYPVRGGTELAVVVIVQEGGASRDWSNDVRWETVASWVGGFHRHLELLVAAAPRWRKWSLHQMAVPPTLAKGRIALAGDAAHPVLPFLAQGGVMALEDAASIALCLAEAPADPHRALARYSHLRRSRVERVAAASARNGHIYHLDGLAAGARNAAMRLMGGERIMAGYDWLYGWRVAGA